MSSYAEFFERATGFAPFPFQERLGERSGLPPRLEAPTGSGKTAAIVLAWLWQRRFAGPELQARTPRRLVYALPMRVLVDQVADEVRSWLSKLDLAEDVGVHVLRGGHVDESWEAAPERDAVLVGTQDQLLSRALNRGFAMSRFRWPMHFALLHNDAWWVLDEVQLMGAGLRTAAQLEGFRRRWSAYGPVGTTFMSATLRPEWLATPDHPAPEDAVALDTADWEKPALKRRTEASKPLARCPLESPKEKALAEWIAEQHRPGTLTLVVVNRVKRCQALAKALRKASKADVQVLHSRFRPAERRIVEGLLKAPTESEGRIVVATQTVEAGVDLSATTLITDLAPWPSLVQRFGRCNRRGEVDDAKVFWLDLDTTKKNASAPYTPEELDAARAHLEGLADARIAGLPKVETEWPSTDLPRASDLLDLFDTDPDLDGNFVDVSRWIRGSGSTDASVYWRTLPKAGPGADEPAPRPEELCPVAVPALAGFVKNHRGSVWQWDPLEGRWARAHIDPGGPAPGFVTAGKRYLVDAAAGGYDPELGWEEKAKPTPPVEVPTAPPEQAFEDDRRSELAGYVRLNVHLQDAHEAARALVEALDLLDAERAEQVARAAGWHDLGKAHPVFQLAAGGPGRPNALLAKAVSFRRYERRGFRHELVSALAAVASGESDLVAYLAATHHGKVRLGLRPLQWADGGESEELRGVCADDALPPVETPTGSSKALEAMPLDLAQLGRGPSGPSWSERALRLLDALGPFRLAYLETLVRVADWRASADPSELQEPTDA
ncbi:MAG TPA: CRISPR-associated helicase Cas3' [Polyangiaceae bacterium LLY-WYZ-15_(1-7)]|nr:CRISPR-associated helicase/endonuclease Cas3 [Myxococcales bacterium]MAT26022.1 CRISPR-associated helicase/endonuclease Cas3 [Sandaracinus sp.]HJK93225.1 CRISPR-associated helicase Cas3' [Polyangiaceae bacterium LLY-WYZ-15_(1-7)]HJL03189.1 CRISPR-associated helicase Cas3' [Polyangiaceae bacterium LLY-WYZ-15_(1-7)]HJL11125.1 CRISPR-associated helicase Cas3' [Polyangiaceae bacterium LLY-WYZ-15_(1-7)]